MLKLQDDSTVYIHVEKNMYSTSVSIPIQLQDGSNAIAKVVIDNDSMTDVYFAKLLKVDDNVIQKEEKEQ